MTNSTRTKLARTVARRDKLAGQLEQAENERDDLIRTAIAEGTTVTDLSQVTGLTRARIYQIRDRRR